MRFLASIPTSFRLIVLAATVAMAVAACGSGDPESLAPAAAEPAAPVPASDPTPPEALPPPPVEPEPPAPVAVEPEPPTAPPPTVPEPVAQPDPPPEPDPPVEPVPEPSPAPPVDPGPLIEVVGGEPVDGVKRIKVKNGETARFSVASDAPAEVHVHGLEVTKNVGPEKDVKFKLETSFEGIFEIELHGPAGDVEIAKLVIEPK